MKIKVIYLKKVNDVIITVLYFSYFISVSENNIRIISVHSKLCIDIKDINR